MKIFDKLADVITLYVSSSITPINWWTSISFFAKKKLQKKIFNSSL